MHAAGSSVEQRLDALLAEAQEARSSVERLMTSRHLSESSSMGVNIYGTQRASTIPLLDAAAAISLDIKTKLLIEPRPPLAALSNGTPTPLGRDAAPNISSRFVRPALNAGGSSSSGGNERAPSREGRAAARLARDLSEARAQIRELEYANNELRTALGRARSEIEASASLRADLDASQARQRQMSEALSARGQELATLRHEKEEAAAEMERLRTLLAAHAWFEHQM